MTKFVILTACLALISSTTDAQTSGPGTGGSPAIASSMEATGTVSDYTPDTALVLDTGSGEPVHYKFAKKVAFSDADGKAVEASGLRKNVRVRVHYMRTGGDLIVDKVTLLE
ncbi:MAG: hypothetical protein H0U88_09205 [Chthoniobacterales bacterium]|nr:hypothetical protein [Chthoniobacterales bacterium]MDQ3118624.1 hypothetical protein [Verrucomicrobiota bacterium]